MIEKIKAFISSFGSYEFGGMLYFWYWGSNGNPSRSFYVPIPLWFTRSSEGFSIILFGQTYILMLPTKDSRTIGFYSLNLCSAEDPFDISTHYVYLNPEELTSPFTMEQRISSPPVFHHIKHRRICCVNFVDDYLAISPDKVGVLTQ